MQEKTLKQERVEFAQELMSAAMDYFTNGLTYFKPEDEDGEWSSEKGVAMLKADVQAVTEIAMLVIQAKFDEAIDLYGKLDSQVTCGGNNSLRMKEEDFIVEMEYLK